MPFRNDLFTKYGQPENRVTATLLGVFERLGISITTEILRSASLTAGGAADVPGVVFRNQLMGASSSDSVPDAAISASFRYLFEVKVTAPLRCEQIESHLDVLRQGQKSENSLLFVLTPDFKRPPLMAQFDDRPVVWLSFRDIDTALEQQLQPDQALGEADSTLVRELRAFLLTLGLTTDPEDTLIVAGGATGYRRFEERGCTEYVCQADRVFRPAEEVKYLGFYAQGAIKPLIGRRGREEPRVLFTPEAAAEWRSKNDPDAKHIADVIDYFLDKEPNRAGLEWTVMLTSPHEPLPSEVVNNTVTKASGRPWAWCLGTRYTYMERLRTVARTSDLDTEEVT